MPDKRIQCNKLALTRCVSVDRENGVHSVRHGSTVWGGRARFGRDACSSYVTCSWRPICNTMALGYGLQARLASEGQAYWVSLASEGQAHWLASEAHWTSQASEGEAIELD